MILFYLKPIYGTSGGSEVDKWLACLFTAGRSWDHKFDFSLRSLTLPFLYTYWHALNVNYSAKNDVTFLWSEKILILYLAISTKNFNFFFLLCPELNWASFWEKKLGRWTKSATVKLGLICFISQISMSIKSGGIQLSVFVLLLFPNVSWGDYNCQYSNSWNILIFSIIWDHNNF